MFQPSYLTEIQFWLALGYLRLRMPEKKGATQIVETTSKILGRWTMEASSEQGFIIKSRRGEEVADGLSDNSSRIPKDGFPQLGEQGNIICQIKWYDDVCSRETYTTEQW